MLNILSIEYLQMNIFRLHRGYVYFGVADTIVADGVPKTSVIIRRQAIGNSDAEAEVVFEKTVNEGIGCDFFFQISATTLYLLEKEHLLQNNQLIYEEYNVYTIDLTNLECTEAGSFHREDGFTVTDMHEYDGTIYLACYNPFDAEPRIMVESIEPGTGELTEICRVHCSRETYPFIGNGMVAGIAGDERGRIIVSVSDFNGKVLSEHISRQRMGQLQSSNKTINMIYVDPQEVMFQITCDDSGRTEQETFHLFEEGLSFIRLSPEGDSWKQTQITP